ncbi:hypothetical protein Y032_0030g2108 [Ancylostoma ceylanicum]|uniref:Uncharacterized protein n=1 Tax=Ancylostoma ceylanicum TaxID=53326 RepID=A0A016UQ44_9BILA|nr:hypothetical protein Y032_0030g2108 [Ancylostoma ceylanicum]
MSGAVNIGDHPFSGTPQPQHQEPYPIYLTVGGKTQRVYIQPGWFLSTLLFNVTHPSTCSFLCASAVS